MDNPERRDPPDFTGLTTSEASRLLALGLSGARRPVDDLLDRLCRPDAAECSPSRPQARGKYPQPISGIAHIGPFMNPPSRDGTPIGINQTESNDTDAPAQARLS